ncbi:MAG: sarcosine oxidase subunit alpha family protein [Pseudomonadota bacterium]
MADTVLQSSQATQPNADPQASSRPAPRRLSAGGLIDRSEHLTFKFDGKTFQGHPGDTLASALLANDVRLVGRSFKYHRPRGILTAGFEEPNAMVELREGNRQEPNTRATMVELYDGLVSRSQNRWPSLSFDVLSVNQMLSPILAAGFYYKTFMWPAAFWEMVYEPIIRRAAGLGSGSREPDPDTYEKAWAHCDVLIIGSGPTGLMAALAAGSSGARVILADADFQPGGRLNAEADSLDGVASNQWVGTTLEELSALPNVRVMPRTTVFGVYDQNTYGAVEQVNDHRREPMPHQPRQRGWKIVTKRAILATGAIERPLVFANNDAPGVMLASAVRTYIHRFGVCPGKQAVVYTTSDDGWRTAQSLTEAGADVTLIDPRTSTEHPTHNGTFDVVKGAVVEKASGGRAVQSVEIRQADGTTSSIDCDLVAVSNGWNPTIHLTCHLGAKPTWDDEKNAFLAQTPPPGMVVGGAAAAKFTLTEALSEGVRMGLEAASSVGCSKRLNIPVPEVDGEETASVTPRWGIGSSTRKLKGKAFVDFQNDVTLTDIELAIQEGFSAAEHVKRYTTLGMATDQGKTANVTGLGVIADLTDQPMANVGTTVFRPPFTPVTLGAFVGHARGRDFGPTRRTPSHDWAHEMGATFTEAGLWQRAQFFPKPDETDWLDTVAREVKTVRSAVGLCDVSTLGKIDIQGADVATFLDRIYANTISTLPLNKVRYGVMLREDGMVMDDGTVCRLGPDHVLVTTTTANAGKVLEHLDFCHQVLWPDLGVSIVPVTEQWAQYAVAGPRSRDLLAKLVDDPAAVSNDALPFMGFTTVQIGGAEARVFRVSFCGELAYEIAIPATYGDALIRALMQAGETLGVAPYGTEALGVMRIEKGHVAGPELDGRTTLRDLGLGKMGAKKTGFVGRTLAQRPALLDPARPILVGLIPKDPSEKVLAGAHLIAVGRATTAENDEGHISSAAFSPTRGHDIALGFLARGRDRIGQDIRAVDPLRGSDVTCTIVDPVFVDPNGEKVRG